MYEVNQILKNRRIELGLTMLDVANKVGVSEGTVSRWESGDIANMKRDKIVLLAKALEISPAVIMGWNTQDDITLTQHETKLIKAYRSKPAMQPAVDTLLGISNDEYYIPVAARNGKSGKVKVTSSEEERKAALDAVLPGVSTPKKPDTF